MQPVQHVATNMPFIRRIQAAADLTVISAASHSETVISVALVVTGFRHGIGVLVSESPAACSTGKKKSEHPSDPIRNLRVLRHAVLLQISAAGQATD